jgi:hypothetical protein
MKKIKLIYLKNQMLVANSIANFIGVLLVNTLMLRIQETFAIEILEYLYRAALPRSFLM